VWVSPPDVRGSGMIQWTNAEGIQGRLQQNPFFSTSEDLSHVFLLPIQKISEQPCSNGESIRHTVLWEGLQTEDLVDKFSIVFLMVKERISFNSFPNMCRGATLLDVETLQNTSPGKWTARVELPR
jgi:hypothetical protein